ncbi:MAG: 30S ribosomal protein S15 [Elusimicrobiales bacterium]|jgi:small subunit ribosomal protein S15|nr:30S ribosomal protein S15 [Elusimicrobiales bacterium]NLH39078.1 30S ribosomal protein S15 [Elusimicrobiota bacterium]
MSTQKIEKSKILEKYGKNSNDTGSAQVQIAIITERINYLSKHLAENPKDFGSRRTLTVLISRRKGLLSYLEKNSNAEYKKIIEQLGLRK